MAAQVPSRLYRSRSQKMIAGVSGGLGEYFDVDPVLIRLLFVVTSFISGMGILAYIVLWIVVPFEGDDGPRFDALKRDFDDISGRVRDYVDRPRSQPAAAPSRGDTPPSGATSAASTATTPYEEASMNPDTASARVPRHDDDDSPTPGSTASTAGTAGAATEDLTITPEPADPTPDPEPRTGARAEDLYGTPYGPPPPYTTTSYTADPYASAPPIPPLTDRRKRRQHWAGAILIVLGVLILGNNLGLLWWVEPEYFLPLILVGAGAWLLFGRGRRG